MKTSFAFLVKWKTIQRKNYMKPVSAVYVAVTSAISELFYILKEIVRVIGA